jgi:hypothetical protein
MQPITLNRRYYDEYFYNLCCSTAKQYNIPTYLEHLSLQWIDLLDKNKPAVVFVPDYLTDGKNFFRWNDLQLEKLNQRQQPTVIATSVNNAHLDWNIDNLYFVHSGSDMLFQQLQYPQLSGCIDKEFAQSYHWACLCRLPRSHRVIVLCVLFGLELDLGYVSTGPHKFNNNNFDDWYNQTLSIDKSIVSLLRLGWQKFVNKPTFIDSDTYNVPPNHNALNFDLNLKHLYNHCALEIVTETTFFNRGQFASEKYLNSVYGCNFPILISNAGTVAYLRNNGFDMFDDVVDHSYDLEPDPVLRIYSAIQKNLHLLSDRDYAIQQWYCCQERFVKNLEYARQEMYTDFANKFSHDLTNLLSELQLESTHCQTESCMNQ